MFRSLIKPAMLLVLASTAYWLWPRGEIHHAPGVLVAAEPVQRAVDPHPLPDVKGYHLTALATYEITARVLHTKHYWSGWGSDLVPFDVALGWGSLSDQSVLDRLKVSHGSRFFFYEWRNEPPVPRDEIVCHAANNHVIAANSAVASFVRNLRGGDVVKMRGYLVNISGENGFHWNSSLSRTDSGRGACEVFYVEAAERQAVAL